MKKYMRFAALLLAVAMPFALFSCARSENKEREKLRVVTTLFPQYDLAESIGAECVEVVKLLPWGSESHTYDPSIKDISAVSKADIFIYTGAELEKWAVTLAENAAESNCVVVDLSQNIPLLEGVGDEAHVHGENEHNHDYDAHIWTNPENAIIMANTILSAFCDADPENADYYKKNAAGLTSELEALDDELEELSKQYDGRTLYFGGRFAFLYMFREYGFNYRSPYQGCGEESEPGIRTIAEITESMKSDGAQYVFYEEMSEGRIAKSLAAETGAQLLMLHSCHNLTADEAESGKSFVSIMRNNIKSLRTALGLD